MLMISNQDSPSKLMTFDEAQMYCFVYQENNLSGWRLPTRDEFEQYINPHPLDPCFIWLAKGYNVDTTKLYRVVPVKDVPDEDF